LNIPGFFFQWEKLSPQPSFQGQGVAPIRFPGIHGVFFAFSTSNHHQLLIRVLRLVAGGARIFGFILA
jgi:hypothetical protein